MTTISFNFLPGVGPLTLLLIVGLAFFVEKHHTARWTVIANSIILISTFGLNDGKFSIYVAISIVAAIIAFLTYINESHMWTILHKFFHIFYGSKTLLAVLIAAMSNILWFSPIFALVIWWTAIKYFDHPSPIEI